MAVYIARRVETNHVRVWRIDDDGRERLVDTIPLPAAAGLRQTLVDAGWQPTGRTARGGLGAILVAPADDRSHPT